MLFAGYVGLLDITTHFSCFHNALSMLLKPALILADTLNYQDLSNNQLFVAHICAKIDCLPKPCTSMRIVRMAYMICVSITFQLDRKNMCSFLD